MQSSSSSSSSSAPTGDDTLAASVDECEEDGGAERAKDGLSGCEPIGVVAESAAELRETLQIAAQQWCRQLDSATLRQRVRETVRRHERISLELRVVALHWSVRGLLRTASSCAAMLLARWLWMRHGIGRAGRSKAA